MRLFMAAARWLSFFLVPLTASALGLGDIVVNSSLNQPFSAEIPVESSDPAELTDLTVELASAETFRRYGLDRPAFLGNFRFSVDAQGANPVIRISSAQSVSEPFVTLLLDVRWPAGRLLREYTALLDPPLFDTATVAAPVAPAQTVPESSLAAEQPVVRPAPAVPGSLETDAVAPTGLFQEPREEAVSQPQPSRPSATPSGAFVADEPAAVEQAPVASESVTQPSPSSESAVLAPVQAGVADDNYTARRGDTLWGIAQRVRGGTGLDINQMMLALYRANPEAFMGNINALKAGAVMRIPPTDATDAISAAEADAEVRQQNSAWNSGASATGDLADTRAGSAETQARLQLVAPSDGDAATPATAPGDAARSGAAVSSGDTGQLQSRINELEQQLNESKRLLSVRDSEMQSLQQRIAELEKSGGVVADTAPLPETPAETVEDSADAELGAVESASGAPAIGELGAEEPVAEESSLDEPVARVPAEAEATVAADRPQGTASSGADADESGVSGLLRSTWLWAAVAAVLLLGLFLVRKRKSAATESTDDRWSLRRQEADEADDLSDFGSATAHQDSIVVEESDFTATDSAVDGFSPAVTGEDVSTSAALATGKFDSQATGKFDYGIGGALPAGKFADQDAAGQDELELPLEKTISTGAPLNLDQADPVAEAEFHMAYGLYDQAADLLTRALKDDPDNRAYRLKLIEVFFVWENKEGFLEQARLLKSGGTRNNDSDWNKVLILGKQLCPADPLFSGVGISPATGAMDLELSADAGDTSIDFVDVGVPDLNFTSTSAGGDELDLDFGSDFTVANPDLAEEHNGNDGAANASGISTVSIGSSDLDFDLGESDSAATMESPTLDVMGAGSPTLAVDFDFDGGETMESPTLASPANEPTLESPTLDVNAAGAETSEMPFLNRSGNHGAFDSEPLVDPTGLDIDLSGLADLPIDSDDFAALNTGVAVPASDSSSPVFADDNKRISPETENFFLGEDAETALANLESWGKLADDTVQVPDEPLASDTIQQPEFNDGASDTAEQPGIADPVDFDLGLPDEPKFGDDSTMTEVGTKLDLARAYIDMGDQDGARSILEEVLDEGGEAQQQQARQLLNELND